MRDGDASTAKHSPIRFGQGFVRDIWYFAGLSADLKPGDMMMPGGMKVTREMMKGAQGR